MNDLKLEQINQQLIVKRRTRRQISRVAAAKVPPYTSALDIALKLVYSLCGLVVAIQLAVSLYTIVS
tara:strand:- start:295 stop:495 length:201 start_codon:yes stop_codon:yes gene_type:complete